MARKLGSPESSLGLACKHLDAAHAEMIGMLSMLNSLYRLAKAHPDQKNEVWSQMETTVKDQYERCVRASMPESEHKSYLKDI